MPKLLYLVTEDWFFVSHFLPMARTAKAAGFEVVVATRVRDHAARIAAEGCRVVSLESERRSFGPFEALRGFFRMVRIVREERPDLVHCIALRMVVLGGLAARLGEQAGATPALDPACCIQLRASRLQGELHAEQQQQCRIRARFPIPQTAAKVVGQPQCA